MRHILVLFALGSLAFALPTLEEVKTILEEEIKDLRPLLAYNVTKAEESFPTLIDYIMDYPSGITLDKTLTSIRRRGPRFYQLFSPVFENYKSKIEGLKEAESKAFVKQEIENAKSLLKFRIENNKNPDTYHRVVIGELKAAGQFLSSFDALPLAAQTELLTTFSEIAKVLKRVFVGDCIGDYTSDCRDASAFLNEFARNRALNKSQSN